MEGATYWCRVRRGLGLVVFVVCSAWQKFLPYTGHRPRLTRPKPGQAKPYIRLLAWPMILPGPSCLRPGQSRGFQAKPEPAHHYSLFPLLASLFSTFPHVLTFNRWILGDAFIGDILGYKVNNWALSQASELILLICCWETLSWNVVVTPGSQQFCRMRNQCKM